MMGIRAELRKWLQWRARYSHWFGLAEHTSVGTITATDGRWWTIEDDEGRFVYTSTEQFTEVTGLRVGDRVEVQALAQGIVVRGPLARGGWMIVRRLEPEDPKPKT